VLSNIIIEPTEDRKDAKIMHERDVFLPAPESVKQIVEHKRDVLSKVDYSWVVNKESIQEFLNPIKEYRSSINPGSVSSYTYDGNTSFQRKASMKFVSDGENTLEHR
jgi:hypothetical protein